MFAIIGQPDGRFFAWHGPDGKEGCQRWMRDRMMALCQTDATYTTLDQSLISDRKAYAWKGKDGTRVIQEFQWNQDA